MVPPSFYSAQKFNDGTDLIFFMLWLQIVFPERRVQDRVLEVEPGNRYSLTAQKINFNN